MPRLADVLCEASPDGTQHLVAYVVTETIVDLLEMVRADKYVTCQTRRTKILGIGTYRESYMKDLAPLCSARAYRGRRHSLHHAAVRARDLCMFIRRGSILVMTWAVLARRTARMSPMHPALVWAPVVGHECIP